MKKRNRYFAIALAVALLLTVADTGITMKKADAATETTAYLEFLDSWWSSSYKGETNSAIIADNAIVDGDGVYRISLDFSQLNGKCAHGITNCIVRIKDGEALYGSKSHIQLRSVKIVTVDGEEKTLDNIKKGYTCADTGGQTSLYLYTNAYNSNAVKDIRTLPDGAGINPSTGDYQLIDGWQSKSIQYIEVIFAFAEDPVALSKIPVDATPKPHTTEGPAATPKATTTATSTPKETTNPWAVPSAAPQGSATPGETPDPFENIVSNSTYVGPEKIFVNQSAFVVAAGSRASATIALLRGADSDTQVSASSGNLGIAVPTLQSDGKLDIAVPASAPAGNSTIITLRFGSSSAAVKVTVRNPIIGIKGAKKSYTIKRKKTAKVSVTLTPKNTANAMTDTVTATISNKKIASVSSVKVSKNKASIKVKALKKGSAKLTVKASGKSASIKIRVK